MTTPHDVPVAPTSGNRTGKGQRTYGWDANTSYSSNRGELFKGYGHTGFTGTSLWIDPDSETAVIFLSNRVHPDGKGNVTRIRGQVATLAAEAILKAQEPGIGTRSPDRALRSVLTGI